MGVPLNPNNILSHVSYLASDSIPDEQASGSGKSKFAMLAEPEENVFIEDGLPC